ARDGTAGAELCRGRGLLVPRGPRPATRCVIGRWRSGDRRGFRREGVAVDDAVRLGARAPPLRVVGVGTVVAGSGRVVPPRVLVVPGGVEHLLCDAAFAAAPGLRTHEH